MSQQWISGYWSWKSMHGAALKQLVNCIKKKLYKKNVQMNYSNCYLLGYMSHHKPCWWQIPPPSGKRSTLCQCESPLHLQQTLPLSRKSPHHRDFSNTRSTPYTDRHGFLKVHESPHGDASGRPSLCCHNAQRMPLSPRGGQGSSPPESDKLWNVPSAPSARGSGNAWLALAQARPISFLLTHI